jgi:hypothetical protein
VLTRTPIQAKLLKENPRKYAKVNGKEVVAVTKEVEEEFDPETGMPIG